MCLYIDCPSLSLWAECSFLIITHMTKWIVRKRQSSSSVLCFFGDFPITAWVDCSQAAFFLAWSVKVRILYFSFYQGLKCCCSLRCAKAALPLLYFSTFLSFSLSLSLRLYLSLTWSGLTEAFLQYVASPSQWMSPPCQESNHAEQSFDTQRTNWTIRCSY